MNIQLSKIKRITIFLAGISAASIPTMGYADWSIVGLGTLGGSYSFADGINDSGQVVGISHRNDFANHAFITGPNGVGMTDLGTLNGYQHSSAFSINESGQVVGYSVLNVEGATTLYHAFITGPNGVGMTDLGTLGGSRSSFARDINDSGQVVGFTKNENGDIFHAFITGPNGVGMTDLGTLGGVYSSAHGINDSGQVVGDASTGRASHAFITGPNGSGMTDLGTLGGFESIARGINDSGEVVGSAATADGPEHSFIFSHGGITDLSLLAPVITAGWTSLVAVSINNNGQMVGHGFHNGHTEAFLLSYTPDTVFDPKPIYIPPPIPEPETYVMLLAGLGLLGFMARNRKESIV
ncbi:MAG: PEP-CTERM sorting domain-containing protein [Nitrosomonas sp.]|nr:PEP-CTERM sorting domain-containing protein [Nitrosomonas sp.]